MLCQFCRLEMDFCPDFLSASRRNDKQFVDPLRFPVSLTCASRFVRLISLRIKTSRLTRFPGSSMVEHSAVNRRVASSNLARGAKFSFSLNQLRNPLSRIYSRKHRVSY
jgi:hypothetical protein